jgi:hypothetical protein
MAAQPYTKCQCYFQVPVELVMPDSQCFGNAKDERRSAGGRLSVSASSNEKRF